MKKCILILFLFFCISSFGQDANYDDSLINVQITQSMAYWVGNSIRTSIDWSNRNVPDIFRAYIGKGLKPDSVFNVTIKVKFLRHGIEELISSRVQFAVNDYRSILFNQPAINGYTGLAAQIVTKAGQGDKSALYLKKWYEERVAAFQSAYDLQKSAVVSWSNN